MTVYTFQELEATADTAGFLRDAVSAHCAGEAYKTAVTADEYDRQRNTTINSYVKQMFTLAGSPVEDFTASNSKIACNLFNRLNTQRCQYSLGAGVSFAGDDDGELKESMGRYFDHDITEAAYYAQIHGVSFPFWNLDKLHVFKLTEFCPFWDEHTGELRAGVRWWRLDNDRPLTMVLYREEGYSTWREDSDGKLRPLNASGDFQAEEFIVGYKTTYAFTEAGGAEVIGEDDYGQLPIVPMYASRLKQSTLVGMRQAIDSYDLVRSGFANDMTDCAMIYWIVENAGGMTDNDLARFRDRLKLHHIAPVDNTGGASAKPYTQEIPYQAREAYLKEIRSGIYEDFGALDVHAVEAGSTNDHIDAAYQPMDENAADFEYWVGEAIRRIMDIKGTPAEPVFSRTRISNQSEQVDMVVKEAQWLDAQTILGKLPNIKASEIAGILARMDEEELEMSGSVSNLEE